MSKYVSDCAASVQGAGKLAKPSPFVARCLKEIGLVGAGNAIDVPCGFGRHAWLAVEAGYNVAAIDIDVDRAAHVRARTAALGLSDRVVVFATNALTVDYAALGSFQLAIVTDFADTDVLDRLTECIEVGGYLVFETPSARGGNWHALPSVGRIAAMLGSAFDLIRYQERHAGPRGTNAVTVKCLAYRR